MWRLQLADMTLQGSPRAAQPAGGTEAGSEVGDQNLLITFWQPGT
ncbi:unnamed protein product [Soboliphyme baturini]|uniref:Uncharacterized protein n=1 Tax=Soboliphyme baturini TaxID=241478 RepID=A0A183IZX7_9BILA|nr:unnamed protein product [Soboliphyme baturini]